MGAPRADVLKTNGDLKKRKLSNILAIFRVDYKVFILSGEPIKEGAEHITLAPWIDEQIPIKSAANFFLYWITFKTI